MTPRRDAQTEMPEIEASELQELANGDGDELSDETRPPLTLDERMIVLERRMREFETEWLSMYDQFRSLYGRIARRQQREEEHERAQPEADKPLNPAALALLGRTG